MPLHIRTCGVYAVATLAPGFDEVISVMPASEHPGGRPVLTLPQTIIEVSDLDDWGRDDLAAIVKRHPDQIVPEMEHVYAIIKAGMRALELSADRRILIHCAAGVSRSVAAALTILAMEDGPGLELLSIERLREASGHVVPRPNLRLIRLADEALGRGGRLLDAIRRATPQ